MRSDQLNAAFCVSLAWQYSSRIFFIFFCKLRNFDYGTCIHCWNNFFTSWSMKFELWVTSLSHFTHIFTTFHRYICFPFFTNANFEKYLSSPGYERRQHSTSNTHKLHKLNTESQRNAYSHLIRFPDLIPKAESLVQTFRFRQVN